MKSLFSFILTGIVATSIFVSCSKDKPNDQPYEPIDPDEKAYNNAEKSIGGIMYDKLWAKETGFDSTNVHYDTMKASGDFFRCKQCHGWDGLGNKGAYINRAAKTTRPKVSGLPLYEIAKSKTYKELFDAIKKSEGRRTIDFDLSTYDPAAEKSDGNKMPDYSELLTDEQIWDLVKFLKEGLIDVNELYEYTTEGEYPTGTITYANIGKDGDAALGKESYATNCAGCHGDNGTKIDIEGKSVGAFGRTKPYEVHHKVTYGQPGSSMKGLFNISTEELKNLYKALQSETDFPDLPK